ncbi:pirin family protein [Neomicrococcus lactis]
MSNLDTRPEEEMLSSGASCDGVELLEPRDVPLGGPRAMNVRRTLPQRQRSLIGAWCFLDHYGPDNVKESNGMNVPQHPHTGLQTASWLFTGEIEHKDSAGFEAIVRPGELNLMTAGHGITHSEFSTQETEILHGAQLWIALPDNERQMPPTFEHFSPSPVISHGAEVRVFLGSMGINEEISSSPVATHTPLVGAEILLAPGATVCLTLDPSFEHGFLLDAGQLLVDGHTLPKDFLGYLPTGRTSAVLTAKNEPVRVLLIGGEPFEEQIVMWWNFVGRTHEEIVAYRKDYMVEMGFEERSSEDAVGDPSEYDDAGLRFGTFPPNEPAPLPAPTLPNIRIKPRVNPAP